MSSGNAIARAKWLGPPYLLGPCHLSHPPRLPAGDWTPLGTLGQGLEHRLAVGSAIDFWEFQVIHRLDYLLGQLQLIRLQFLTRLQDGATRQVAGSFEQSPTGKDVLHHVLCSQQIGPSHLPSI